MHLIDTSVWINFLRGKQDSKVLFLESLLEEGDAFLCEVTYAEICFGARGTKQFKKYSQHFSSLPFLSLPGAWHKKASEMGFTLRAKGHKPFFADLMIALVAIEHRASLLTTDEDFEPYRELFGLALI